MLEELCKHDVFFRSVALNICKDKELADDLVQEMYLIIHDCNSEIKSPKYYAIQIIKNLFLKECKRNKAISIEDLSVDFKDDLEYFSPDDTEQEIIEKAKKLKYPKKDLLIESYDKSLRQIQKDFKICYMSTNRELEKARKEVLGDDYKKLYKNKRRKRHD